VSNDSKSTELDVLLEDAARLDIIVNKRVEAEREEDR